MDLSSGQPTAQGETVTKVLVDNKPFFGDDAQAALDNLPAEIIDKVQVYDEKSDQAKFTGFDDGNTTKTINIVTKADKRAGTFGKVFAGGGTDKTYSLGGNINYFNGDRRLSLIDMNNNINVQNFSSQDLSGVSSGGFSGGRGGRGGGSGSNNFMTNQKGGVSRTNAIGLNYSDKWGKKIDVTGSYFFNNSKNVSETDINREYVLPEQTGQTYEETDHSVSRNYNHRFNLKMDYEIDENNSILFTPQLSLQKTKSLSTMFGQTFDNNGLELLNSTTNNYSSNGNAYNLGGQFLYRHKFSKQGRTLSVAANGTLSRNKNTNILEAINTFVDTTLNQDLQQLADQKGNNRSIRANVNYTEPISKNSYVQARYGISYQNGASDKFTYDYVPGLETYSSLDSQLTNVYRTNYLTNSFGLAYRIVNQAVNASFGLSYQNASLNSDNRLPLDFNLNRKYNNVLPYASLQYKFNKTNNLSISYRTSTNAPSVAQLQGVIDNRNPLQLQVGNPDLKQSYQHNLRARFRSANVDKSLSVFGMLSGSYTKDYIGSNTTVAGNDTLLPGNILLAKGGRLISQSNMSGNWNVSGFGGVGMPLYFLKSNLNINLQAGYTRLPGIVNQQKNFSNNTNLGLGLTLSSNISEMIDFTVNVRGSFNNVTNTVNTQSDNRFYNQSESVRANYSFWKGFVLSTDFNHQFYAGLSSGFNPSFILWNAGIAKKLFKNEQGEIKFSVYDLLGQNKSIQRTISEIYSQDTRTNVLGRYFMLTFTYTLRGFRPEGNATQGGRRGGSWR